MVKAEVKKTFDVDLELEVKIVGEEITEYQKRMTHDWAIRFLFA